MHIVFHPWSRNQRDPRGQIQTSAVLDREMISRAPALIWTLSLDYQRTKRNFSLRNTKIIKLFSLMFFGTKYVISVLSVHAKVAQLVSISPQT
jgi:hypothetical protein